MEIKYGGKMYTVGYIIKFLHPAARFGTFDMDQNLFLLTFGEPPALPIEPDKNTELTKGFCGMAKYSIIT